MLWRGGARLKFQQNDLNFGYVEANTIKRAPGLKKITIEKKLEKLKAQSPIYHDIELKIRLFYIIEFWGWGATEGRCAT